MENRLTPQFAAKVERLMGRDERSLADRADLAAEIERLRAQLKAEHETAVAAIAGSEKEIERLRSQIDTCQGNAHYRAWQESQAENERLTKQNLNLFDERDWLEAVLDLTPREMAQVAMDYFMTEGTEVVHDLDEQQLTREMRQRLKDLADGTHEGLAVRERPEREELAHHKE